MDVLRLDRLVGQLLHTYPGALDVLPHQVGVVRYTAHVRTRILPGWPLPRYGLYPNRVVSAAMIGFTSQSPNRKAVEPYLLSFICNRDTHFISRDWGWIAQRSSGLLCITALAFQLRYPPSFSLASVAPTV